MGKIDAVKKTPDGVAALNHARPVPRAIKLKAHGNERVSDDDPNYVHDVDRGSISAHMSGGTNICGMDPDDFEDLVLEVLMAELEGAVLQQGVHDDLQGLPRRRQTHDASGSRLHGGDGGEDIHIRFTHGLLSTICIVQAKCYTLAPGPDVVRDLVGTMTLNRATHGILVTSYELGDDNYKGFTKET